MLPKRRARSALSLSVNRYIARAALEMLEPRLLLSRASEEFDLLYTPDAVPQAPDDILPGPADPPDNFDLHQVGSLEPALVPVSNTTWLPVGPAPIKSGQTPGSQAVAGRITGIAVDPTDSNVIFITAAGGGIWKTTNSGSSWSAMTDDQTTPSMGSIII